MTEIITRKEALERGLKRYFTGKPCANGHVCERVYVGECVECIRAKEARRVRSRSDEHRARVRNKYRKMAASYLALKELGIGV